MVYRRLFFISVVTILVISCARDMTEPQVNTCGTVVDYDGYAKGIIDASCALSGCHDGMSAGVPGNFTSYEGLAPFLNSGVFATRVFDMRDNPVTGMPPDNAVDFGGQANLDDETIMQLMLWANAGYPEQEIEVVATYDETIQNIIDLSCAYSGCHNGTPGVPGDYSSYAGLELDLENGSFYRRVVESRDDPVLGMPPDRATGPTDLTEEEFQLILCWVENDYPEN